MEANMETNKLHSDCIFFAKAVQMKYKQDDEKSNLIAIHSVVNIPPKDGVKLLIYIFDGHKPFLCFEDKGHIRFDENKFAIEVNDKTIEEFKTSQNVASFIFSKVEKKQRIKIKSRTK